MPTNLYLDVGVLIEPAPAVLGVPHRSDRPLHLQNARLHPRYCRARPATQVMPTIMPVREPVEEKVQTPAKQVVPLPSKITMPEGYRRPKLAGARLSPWPSLIPGR